MAERSLIKYKYTDEEIKALYPESQQLLEQDTPFAAMIFARDNIKSRWKAAEDFAVKWYDDQHRAVSSSDSKDWRDLYPENIADCWVSAEGFFRPNLQNFMSVIMFNYLWTVVGEGPSSWPEAEHIIFTNPSLAAIYADQCESEPSGCGRDRSSREEGFLTRVFIDICSDSYEPMYWSGGHIEPGEWILEYWRDHYHSARWPEFEKKLDDFITYQEKGVMYRGLSEINELRSKYVKSIDWTDPKNDFPVPYFLTKLILARPSS
jgi:hypothetical protein